MDVPKRNTGMEILQGIREIKAHKAGKTALATHELARPVSPKGQTVRRKNG